MKTLLILLLITLYNANCKKIYAPVDKNANIAFINMEGGGYNGPPGPAMSGSTPTQRPGPAPTPAPASPAQPAKPAPTSPPAVPAPQKPIAPTPVTQRPVVPNPVTPSKPIIAPTPARPVPVNPYPTATVGTTPLPGSVKHLINYYDSQGKGSVIRPYSYSQAVKQG